MTVGLGVGVPPPLWGGGVVSVVVVAAREGAMCAGWPLGGKR